MPKTIKFEGSTHQFPDDATDDEISSALNSAHPARSASSGAEALGRQGIHLTEPNPANAVREKMLGYPSAGPVDTTGQFDYGQIGSGIKSLGQPGGEAKAHGLSQIGRGVGKGFAVPAILGGALTNPVGTAGMVARGAIAQPVVEEGSKALGLPSGYAEALGDTAGLAAGGTNPGARIGGAAGAFTKAAGSDLAMGTGKMAAGVGIGAALHGTHIPGAHYAGAYPVFAGGRQVLSGLGKGIGAARKSFSPPRLAPMPEPPATPQTFGPSGSAAAPATPSAPIVPIRSGLASGRKVGGIQNQQAPVPETPPAPTPLSKPTTAKGLGIAEQLRDAMQESAGDKAALTDKGILRFGQEPPFVDEPVSALETEGPTVPETIQRLKSSLAGPRPINAQPIPPQPPKLNIRMRRTI